jgi:hypothetical protein
MNADKRKKPEAESLRSETLGLISELKVFDGRSSAANIL